MILFWILGPVRVRSDSGEPVRFAAPPKVRALLAALLLLPNRWVTKTRLARYLWRDTGSSWEPNLRTYGSQLRRALEASRAGLGARLQSARDLGFRIDVDSTELDVDRFLQLSSRGNEQLHAGDYVGAAGNLSEGLALWHDPVGADLPDTDAFRAHFHALDHRHRYVRADFYEAALSVGCASRTIAGLRDLATADPLAERPVRLLMQAQVRIGAPAAALDTYHHFRKLLAEVTGTDPSRELEGLYRQVLRGEDQRSGHHRAGRLTPQP